MRFCGQCGGSLSLLCRACGAQNDATQLFCGQCGVKLEADPAERNRPDILAPRIRPAGDPPRIASERRHVTVLFADLVGFTSLSGQRDAEDVRELLSQYFATARTVIGRYGGSIEKFIGDAVMAVWGVRAIHENDAERAVRAALELVDEVAEFGEHAGIPGLRARAGVLTGEAAVNLDADDDGMVAGDLVNTASRVQSVAEPGSVFVGESTRSASEAAIEYRDAGSHQLKGKPEPLQTLACRPRHRGGGWGARPTGLEPPFVGRDRELRLLKEFLHTTSAEGRAPLAVDRRSRRRRQIEAGLGVFKCIDGLTETIWYQRGRCLAYGEGVAFAALTEMVRMRTGILENESPDTARQKLRQSVEEFIHDDEERAWVEPRVAHLLRTRGARSVPTLAISTRRGGTSSSASPRNTGPCSSSRTCNGLTAASSISSSTCSSGRAIRRSWWLPSLAPISANVVRGGARASEGSHHCSSNPFRPKRWGSCSGMVPGLPAMLARSSSTVPRRPAVCR